MSANDSLALHDRALDAIRARLGDVPPILVIAGSGLGTFAGTLSGTVSLSYGDIPGFPVSTVAGHAGTLVRGTAGGVPILVMNGRKHLYEGVDPSVATFPLRTLLRGGVKVVILSNAAGSISPKLAPGDLMLITDHVNLQFRNPLIGPNVDAMGPRFPDMSDPYSRELQALAREVAREQGEVLREGVYLALLGPTYETRAEVFAMRAWADVVGMSTAIETTVAVHAGARVLGITLVTNSHVASGNFVTTHDEVMEAGREAAGRFARLVSGIVARL